MPCDTPTILLPRKWRKTTALNQSAAAAALGVAQCTLSKIENGERRASIGLLERMRAIYSLSDQDVSDGVTAMASIPDAPAT